MENKPNSKTPPTPSSASKKKLESESVSYYVEQLAIGMGVLIPDARIAMYVHALSDLSEKQLAYGFEQALKHFRPDFGKKFPLPREIRDWAYQWKPKAENTRLLLERGDKPADWEPMTTEQAKAFIQDLRKK